MVLKLQRSNRASIFSFGIQKLRFFQLIQYSFNVYLSSLLFSNLQCFWLSFVLAVSKIFLGGVVFFFR